MNADREDLTSILFRWDSIKGKSHLGDIPFTNKYRGDFIYLTNRQDQRYSFLYSNLEEAEVYENCNMSMGYTSLLICRSIIYLEGSASGNYDQEVDANEELAGKYCLFQNPLTKVESRTQGDIVRTFPAMNVALAFARMLFEERSISVLVAEIKAQLNWH